MWIVRVSNPFSGRLARVESARLVVASDPDTGTCVSYRGENVRGEALDVVEHVETAKLRARHAQVELVKPSIGERVRENARGLPGIGREPIHDRLAMRERRKAARVTKAVVSEPRADRLERLEHLPRRALAHPQVVFVGLVLRLARRVRDAHREAGTDEREDELELVRAQRPCFVIARDDMRCDSDRVVLVEYAIGGRVRHFEDESTRDHVAEIEKAGHLAVAHENVVVVPIVVDDAFRDSLELRRDLLFEAPKIMLYEPAPLIVRDMFEPFSDGGCSVFRVPIQIAILRFVREAFERLVEAAHEASETAEERFTMRCRIRKRFSREEVEEPAHVAAFDRLDETARECSAYSRNRKLRVFLRDVGERLILKFQVGALFAEVRDFQNELFRRSLGEKVLVALARELFDLFRLDPVDLVQNGPCRVDLEPWPRRLQLHFISIFSQRSLLP